MKKLSSALKNLGKYAQALALVSKVGLEIVSLFTD